MAISPKKSIGLCGAWKWILLLFFIFITVPESSASRDKDENQEKEPKIGHLKASASLSALEKYKSYLLMEYTQRHWALVEQEAMRPQTLTFSRGIFEKETTNFLIRLGCLLAEKGVEFFEKSLDPSEIKPYLPDECHFLEYDKRLGVCIEVRDPYLKDIRPINFFLQLRQSVKNYLFEPGIEYLEKALSTTTLQNEQQAIKTMLKSFNTQANFFSKRKKLSPRKRNSFGSVDTFVKSRLKTKPQKNSTFS